MKIKSVDTSKEKLLVFLKEIIIESNLNQNEIEEITGMNQGNMSKILSGKRKISFEKLFEILLSLGYYPKMELIRV